MDLPPINLPLMATALADMKMPPLTYTMIDPISDTANHEDTKRLGHRRLSYCVLRSTLIASRLPEKEIVGAEFLKHSSKDCLDCASLRIQSHTRAYDETREFMFACSKARNMDRGMVKCDDGQTIVTLSDTVSKRHVSTEEAASDAWLDAPSLTYEGFMDFYEQTFPNDRHAEPERSSQAKTAVKAKPVNRDCPLTTDNAW